MLSAFRIIWAEGEPATYVLRVQPDLTDDREFLAEWRPAAAEANLLEQLFGEAQERARGWERVLQTIEEMVAGEGAIG